MTAVTAVAAAGARPVRRLLVANRGEIASRVFRTCRRLGIETVAVHSDADAGLPYVREADVGVRLPGVAAADTYLRGDLLLDAARRSGADAVHPGYGFLSENADFARAVVAAGFTWIGPAAESIEAMGSKVRAKELMRAAGVPVLAAPARPTAADLPLLVKASAGGGGRGMRVVRRLEDLDGELARARAEAESAFGDGTVFVEPYLEGGRHVEVQVVGTRDGVLVLGERDCSLQRRHQKVVEEAPAPGLSQGARAALHAAGRAAAEAIGYLGAGTVEFLLDPGTQRFWFLEMNTRLQVEHPVTELVHGVDLVAMQIAVASTGSCAPRRGPARAQAHDLTQPDGHAIEVRLYAEDPAAAYRPQSGRLSCFEIPAEDGVRVDAGVETGSEVSTHYDAMLAKVVAHAPTRSEAALRLAGVLARARIHGVVTNRDQLVEVLRDERFLAGEVGTAFLDRRPPERRPGPGAVADAALVAAIGVAERGRAARTVQRGIPVAWRNVPSQPQRTTFTGPAGDEHTVEWWGGRDGYRAAGVAVVEVRGAPAPGLEATHATDITHLRIVLERDGARSAYDLAVSGLPDREVVDVDSVAGHVRLTRVPRFADPATAVATGSLLAPMPGTVVEVTVAKGDVVGAGQPLLVLEAMKMQHPVAAPHPGVVDRLDVEPGAQVAAGQVLAVVVRDPAPEEGS